MSWQPPPIYCSSGVIISLFLWALNFQLVSDISFVISVGFRLQTLVLRWLEVFVATGTRVRSRGSLGPLKERIYFWHMKWKPRGTTTLWQHSHAHVWHRASVQYLSPVANKKGAFLSSTLVRCFILFVSHVVCTFLLAFERLSPNVWETWMILTRKRLLVDIFVSRRLPKSFACCEFVCVNFEPWF